MKPANERLITSSIEITKNNEVVVDKNYEWQPMNTCPIAKKVQLLNPSSVAVYGKYNPKDDWPLAWSPLPKVPVWLKEKLRDARNTKRQTQKKESTLSPNQE